MGNGTTSFIKAMGVWREGKDDVEGRTHESKGYQ